MTLTGTAPKHMREFRQAREVAEWSARGVVHPTYRGKHAADTRVEQPAARGVTA